MKLQVAFDLTDLDAALTVAKDVAEYADILEVGSLLIYKYGDTAVRRFKETFPSKTILADAKIVDRTKDAITLFSYAGADWITVLAGAGRTVIHSACTVAHERGKKIMLDLLDAPSLGQSALEAQSLGVDALLFHKPADEDEHMQFLERWDMVKGNTQIPVYISTNITKETFQGIIESNPAGIVIGKAITHAEDPATQAAYFAQLLHS